MSLQADYYDGRSARCHAVTLTVEAGVLQLRGDAFARNEPLAKLKIPASLGHAPRLILFADGARCEITDHAGFAALLPESNRAAFILPWLETRWSIALGALLLILASMGAAYVWGLPWMAQQVAARVPPQVLALMDEQFLHATDGRILHPTALSEARQQALLARVHALHWPPGTIPPTRILFRSSPEIGPNAFALPGGTVVILDQLVMLAHNDDEIIGVLAHEIGHVTERHALRQMLQASAVGLVMTWYIGDVSSVLAAAPTVLLETRYSRNFEQRADDFAARALELNGIPPSRLADMLESLEQAHAERQQKTQQGAASSRWQDYLSSHPATQERIRALREPKKTSDNDGTTP